MKNLIRGFIPFAILLVVAVFLLAPQSGRAATTQELQTLLNSLLQQVAQLRAQLAQMQSNSVSSVSNLSSVNGIPQNNLNVAVILVRFSGVTPNPSFTKEVAQENVFGNNDHSAQKYFETISGGAWSFQGKVMGIYSIPSNGSGCDSDEWSKEADAAVRAAGEDLSSYSYFMYDFDKGDSQSATLEQICGFGGFADRVNKKAFILGPTTNNTIFVHEFGHLLGLGHANSLDCKTQAIASYDQCKSIEYGDPSDVMGYDFSNMPKEFNGPNRAAIGLLPLGDVIDVNASGTYQIQVLESNSPGPKLLKLKKQDTNEFYYIEYRQPIDFDKDIDLGMAYGGLIHIGSDVNSFNLTNYYPSTKLVITKPQSCISTPYNNCDPVEHSSLRDGESFVDAANGITISQVEHSSSGATFRIVLGPAYFQVPITPSIDSFTANPATISVGQNTTISWSSSNSTNCSLDNGIGIPGSPVSGSVIATPLNTTTYTLTCIGTYRTTTSAKVVVTVNNSPAPNSPSITSFTATPSTISSGQTTLLTWTSSNASYCTLSTGNSTYPANGSAGSVPPSSMIYTLTCYGANGASVSSNAPVVVSTSQPSITSFTVTPSTISPGQTTMLNWTSANTSYCSLNTGNSSYSSNGTVGSIPIGSMTYTLTCYGPSGGSTSATASVTVTTNNTPSITSFTANPQTISSGQTTNISWTSVNATNCVLNNGADNSNRPTSGSLTAAPINSTTYTMTCSGSGSSASATVSVTVNQTNTPKITSFTVSPSVITSTQTTLLNWTSINTSYCTLSTGNSTYPSNATVGSSPGISYTYTLTCYGSGGSTSAQANVTVRDNGAVAPSESSLASVLESMADILKKMQEIASELK